MNQYQLYRLQRGLTPAEQRAADQHVGELAAALAGARRSVTRSLSRGLGALARRGRVVRTRKAAGMAAAPVGR
jgi:hypothetical protein